MAVNQLHEAHDGFTIPAAPTSRDRMGIPALVAATIISGTGNNLTAIAIPWFVYATTGSAAKTGLVAFAGLLPVLISGLVGGLVIDRVGFKRSSVLSDIISGVTVAIIPTLYLLDALQFWHLLALTFAGAIFDVPGAAARDSMVPQLAARVRMPLERANSARQLGIYSASFVGPILAGVLIAALGATTVLLLDAASFAISALVIGLLVPFKAQSRTRPGSAEAQQSPANFLSEALGGVRLLMGDPLLSTIVFISVFANFLFSPLIAVIFPVYVKVNFGSPQAFGFLVAAFGAGSIISTLGYAAIGARLRRYPVFATGLAVASAGLWFLPWAQLITVSIFGAFLTGTALGPMNAAAMVVIQERVPEEMLGRAFSSLMALATLASPVGVLLAGLALDAVSSREVLAAIAAGFTLISVFGIASPALRSVDQPPHPDTPD
jgi:MFS family permease